MADFVQKEKYEGVWNGRDVRFNRVWRGHRLTDKECEALCNGDTIDIDGLKSQKTGNSYGVRARLADLEYDGHPYVGLEQVGFMKRGVPQEFLGHKFTEDERIMLEAGKDVKVDGLNSKKNPGKTFSAKLRYDEAEDRIVMDFN